MSLFSVCRLAAVALILTAPLSLGGVAQENIIVVPVSPSTPEVQPGPKGKGGEQSSSKGIQPKQGVELPEKARDEPKKSKDLFKIPEQKEEYLLYTDADVKELYFGTEVKSKKILTKKEAESLKADGEIVETGAKERGLKGLFRAPEKSLTKTTPHIYNGSGFFKISQPSSKGGGSYFVRTEKPNEKSDVSLSLFDASGKRMVKNGLSDRSDLKVESLAETGKGFSVSALNLYEALAPEEDLKSELFSAYVEQLKTSGLRLPPPEGMDDGKSLPKLELKGEELVKKCAELKSARENPPNFSRLGKKLILSRQNFSVLKDGETSAELKLTAKDELGRPWKSPGKIRLKRVGQKVEKHVFTRNEDFAELNFPVSKKEEETYLGKFFTFENDVPELSPEWEIIDPSVKVIVAPETAEEAYCLFSDSLNSKSDEKKEKKEEKKPEPKLGDGNQSNGNSQSVTLNGSNLPKPEAKNEKKDEDANIGGTAEAKKIKGQEVVELTTSPRVYRSDCNDADFQSYQSVLNSIRRTSSSLLERDSVAELIKESRSCAAKEKSTGLQYAAVDFDEDDGIDWGSPKVVELLKDMYAANRSLVVGCTTDPGTKEFCKSYARYAVYANISRGLLGPATQRFLKVAVKNCHSRVKVLEEIEKLAKVTTPKEPSLLLEMAIKQKGQPLKFYQDLMNVCVDKSKQSTADSKPNIDAIFYRTNRNGTSTSNASGLN
jgi:hypothetical protein